MNNEYKVTVGLEVHVELDTKSKMFCGCKNEPHISEPNSNICPVCLAHPGILPVPNMEAVKMVMLFGEAVNAKASTYSEFDRKNYFYPDIPKAYQISQYAFPFLTGGSILGVELTRVHLEEDTARSQHENEGISLVDFNRAGVPLMELVTEPVIHDAVTAVSFAKELQLILRTIGISQAQMERGQMRVEANISVSKTEQLGTKVEVKNLNSFKSVESAIVYEVARHKAVLESGMELIQETRGWNEVKLKTFSQRKKESAKDYRYFPDPDIPKLNIDRILELSKDRLNEIMPELPHKKRLDYKNLGLTDSQIEIVISNKILDRYLKKLSLKTTDIEVLKLSANYLTSDVLAEITNKGLENIELTSENFIELMTMVSESNINSRIAKNLLKEILSDNNSPAKLAKERGLLQNSDPAALKSIVESVVSENTAVFADFKSGNKAALQFLIGQAMKKTRGSGNPKSLTYLFEESAK